MLRTIMLAAVMLAATLSIGGCLVSTSSSTYETGRRVSGNTLSQVQPGVTSEAWLLAMLGEPSSRTAVEGGTNTEILRYDYQKRTESGGTVLLIFAGSSSKSETSSTVFEVTDGVVTRYWSE